MTEGWGHRLVLGLLTAVLAVVVFANSWGVFAADIKPEVYLAPGRMWAQFLSSWVWSPSLGHPNFNVGLAPTVGILAVLRETGMSAEMAYKTFHLVLWFVGGAGAARLLRDLAPDASRWSPVVAAVVFLANPYTVAAGSTLAIALPLCLLPWQLVTFIRALRDPASWRWPAAFGLTWFLMSGMNVAIVPVFQLLAIFPVTYVLVRTGEVTWRTGWTVIGRCAAWVVALSLYWLIPSLHALRTGAQVVEGSETLEGIHQVASLTEVLRGLGLWVNYGQGALGPWVPEFASYVSDPAVILVTGLLPVLALLALRAGPNRTTLVGGLFVGLAAVVMVGVFPGSGISPFGRLLGWLFEAVSPISAFRTTNKIGSVLVLGYALLIGLSAPGLISRVLPRRRGTARVIVMAVTGILVIWALPAFSGRLYPSPVVIPEYWTKAAEMMNSGDPNARVLFLPGQVRSAYRWSAERPDDLMNSLLSRPGTVPETTSASSPPAGNLLAALDDTAQSAVRTGSAVSTYATYLGADQVLLRHDTVWEDRGGASPERMERVLSNDPGLFGIGNFGEPGENVYGGSSTPGYAEFFLSPLQLYAVHDWRPMVRAETVRESVVVVGDGWSVAAMERAGLVDERPLFRYAHDLGEEAFAATIPTTGRYVLTDTNRRRDVISNRLTSGNSALRAAEESADSNRALGPVEDQTVLIREGARVTATQTGAAFFDLPYGVAENAFDGVPSTSWLFGDFQRGVGAQLTIALPAAVPLGDLRVEQPSLGPVEIASIRVSAGGETRDLHFPADGPVRTSFGTTEADGMTITVTGLRGEGFNSVGISEVVIEGPELAGQAAQRIARVPDTLTRRRAALSTAERTDMDAVPLDVVLTRSLATSSLIDDEESHLLRLFSLPSDRRYTGEAGVRVTGDRERLLDRISGIPDTTFARSSGFYFDAISLRASAAADGSPETAWVPGGELESVWWEVHTPRRSLDSITVSQSQLGTDSATRYATEATVYIDGRLAAETQLSQGATEVPLPSGSGGSVVRVEFAFPPASAAEWAPPRLEIDAGVDLRPKEAAQCVPVATVDGGVLAMRPAGETLPSSASEGVTWETCDSVGLAAGEHRLGAMDGMVLDWLTLRDIEGLDSRPTDVDAPPALDIRSRGLASLEVGVGPATEDFALLIGQAHDPRWRATAAGRDLGPAQIMNGYSSGWIVPSGDSQIITVEFSPQRQATAALWVSGLALLVALILVLPPSIQRRLVAALRPLHNRLHPRLTKAESPESGAGTSLGGLRHPSSETSKGMRATRRRPRIRRWQPILVLLVPAFFLGVGGAVGGSLILVGELIEHRPSVPPAIRRVATWCRQHSIHVGASLTFTGILLYVVLARFTGEGFDAAGIHRTLVPHTVAAVGLTLALIGGLRQRQEGPTC